MFNKKLTSLEKDRLRNFIQCHKEIKGSEKLEIIDIIEHSKKIKVSDIDLEAENNKVFIRQNAKNIHNFFIFGYLFSI